MNRRAALMALRKVFGSRQTGMLPSARTVDDATAAARSLPRRPVDDATAAARAMRTNNAAPYNASETRRVTPPSGLRVGSKSDREDAMARMAASGSAPRVSVARNEMAVPGAAFDEAFPSGQVGQVVSLGRKFSPGKVIQELEGGATLPATMGQRQKAALLREAIARSRMRDNKDEKLLAIIRMLGGVTD